ncbi:glycosyltransferase family 2 protein [Fusicatenibacter saccharivorans]|uniref:glycosyltransferase family 2 protein n=1 Tax=Fusicatenibacter saccharivorans TaxID=1150298 RepID=UPI003D0458C2
MARVSIIMPVYNAEKYLREAIESVLKQTYLEFELLLINDRSTDNSKEICQEYSKKDSRIVFLENDSAIHGPGPTRNIGLDYAMGEYIYFMDADDWIEDCLLKCAVSRMQETNADIVQFGVIYEYSDGNNPEQYFWGGKDLLTKDKIKKDFSAYWKENRNSLWMYLFRREKVKTIRFENIIIGEDISYIMDALSNADKIAYIKKALYHYRYVEGSTSHRWVENTIECREIIWNHQLNFLKSFQGDMDKLAYAEVAYDNYIWAIYQLSSNLCTLSYREKKRELLRIKEAMGFEQYRAIYPLKLQHGIQKVKYMLVKYNLERLLLLFGPIFLRIVRGE